MNSRNSDYAFLIGMIFFLNFAVMAMIKHSQNQLKDELQTIWINQQKIYKVLEGNYVFTQKLEPEVDTQKSD